MKRMLDSTTKMEGQVLERQLIRMEVDMKGNGRMIKETE